MPKELTVSLGCESTTPSTTDTLAEGLQEDFDLAGLKVTLTAHS